jgi:putative membrane protein insertion efficiency factor
MPTLRRCLKRPETYLAVFALFVAAAAGDALQPADRQISARAYVGLVEFYQADISPKLRSYIRCRYEPTCSEYSKQAVERFGILGGLVLSWRRIRSCRRPVPLGTFDPVPGLEEGY